jgi:hypothetical protein
MSGGNGVTLGDLMLQPYISASIAPTTGSAPGCIRVIGTPQAIGFIL